uniref:Peptidase S1 domain-containing protein n=1 Tax=Panagrolaimus davidi TaxID=227884 RepID=A0A914QP54_9BILA
MEVQIPILTKDCEIWKQQNYKILCAGTKTERVDHGDSGGPFFYTKNDILYQIGIVHGGGFKNGQQADGDAEFGLFTRVSVYCDWIGNITNGEAKCQDIPPTPPPPPTPAPQSGGMSYKIIFPILSMILTFFIAL